MWLIRLQWETEIQRKTYRGVAMKIDCRMSDKYKWHIILISVWECVIPFWEKIYLNFHNIELYSSVHSTTFFLIIHVFMFYMVYLHNCQLIIICVVITAAARILELLKIRILRCVKMKLPNYDPQQKKTIFLVWKNIFTESKAYVFAPTILRGRGWLMSKIKFFLRVPVINQGGCAETYSYLV